MLEKNGYSIQKKARMSEEHAKTLCRKLESGGITLPDNCVAFQSKK